MKQRPDGLLEEVRSEGRDISVAGSGNGSRRALSVVTGTLRTGTGPRGSIAGLVVANQVSVVLLDGATEHLEGHREKENADTRAGKHSMRSDAPGSCDKATVYGIVLTKVWHTFGIEKISNYR